MNSRKRNVLAVLLSTSIMASNILVTQAAEIDNSSKQKYTYNEVLGVYRDGNTPKEIVEDKEDMNYILEDLIIDFNSDSINLTTHINNEKITIDASLYPSQLNAETPNKILGIADSIESANYDVLKLTIDQKADSSTLLLPNMHLEGNTVISFALYNRTTLEEYYFQFPVNSFDFDSAYSMASNNLTNKPSLADDVMDTEVAYFALQPKSEIEKTFKAIDGMSSQNEGSVSDKSQFTNSEINDLEGEEINQLLEMSKEGSINLSPQTYLLIPNIPDWLYKVQENGTWTNGDTGFDSNGNLVGYTIYHMNDSYSGNALNYALRYYVSSRFNWVSNEFETSFNLSHNVWVQYVKNSNSIYLFDDRASNARIIMSPEIYFEVNIPKDSDGYFVSRMTNACKNGNIADNIAQLLIGYVPYLSDANKLYQTLTSSTATGNNSKIWFEYNYTKEARAKISNLKYAPNDRGYAQDYIGMTIWANNVNSVNHGYKWTCYAK